MELEVSAVAKRFETENLKPFQFKQRRLLEKQRSMFGGQLPVSACASLLTRWIPLSAAKLAFGSIPSRAGEGGHKFKQL
jgi:hypothetical protein